MEAPWPASNGPTTSLPTESGSPALRLEERHPVAVALVDLAVSAEVEDVERRSLNRPLRKRTTGVRARIEKKSRCSGS